MIKSKIALLGGTGFVGQNVAEVFTDNQLNFDIISKSKGYDSHVEEIYVEISIRKTRLL